MGNWNINIQGIGCHNNTDRDLDYDADKMAKEFVKKLVDSGHTIENATFTFGGKEDLIIIERTIKT